MLSTFRYPLLSKICISELFLYALFTQNRNGIPVIFTFNMHFDKENDCVHTLISAMPHHRRRDFSALHGFAHFTIASKSSQRNQNETPSLNNYSVVTKVKH